ncbi:sacsin N-terminal ATP-binding-like domain-containing protein [Streptomyces sp. NBC_01244]|uniref:sacsin N-terminal ATP-binding-like domain-containing protein n=1 Tax=Streptomyces sp. NBC_01244 TaxID=2903797 RepID=UPI002E13DB2E|nr:hypothetical protein OG247_00420 [Streptomyces sp. NBC_01244]
MSTVQEADRAIRLLDEGLRGGLGVHLQMAEGAQEGAETLSTNPLQFLSEFVQNADDAGARQLRFLRHPDALLVAHDGGGLRLGDVLLLSQPWLSGKKTDARSTGRFGIGLSTLRALSTTWEAHCHPFHVRFVDLTLEPVPAPELPVEIAGPGWTVFRIPLEPGVLPPEELLQWFESWSDASLLFLRSIERIEVKAGGSATVLALSWEDVTTQRFPVDGAEHEVKVQHARTADGALWRVYTVEVPPRPDWVRHHKALGATVPVGVALPLGPQARGPRAQGSVHAGLPVAPLGVAARVHAQFDPVASREGFAGSRLNAQLVPVVADLWAAGVRDVLERVDPTAWHLVPLPPPTGSAPPERIQDRSQDRIEDRVQGRIEERILAELLARARRSLAAELTLTVPETGRSAPLADFAAEETALAGVLADADVARLGGVPYSFPAAARDGGGRWRQVLADWRVSGADLIPEVRVVDALGLFAEEQQTPEQLVRLSAVALDSGLGFQLSLHPCVVTADGLRLQPRGKKNAFAIAGAAGPLDVLGIVLDLHPAYEDDGLGAKRVVEWLKSRGCLVSRDDTAALLRIASGFGEAGGRLSEAGEPTSAERLVALQRALAGTPKTVRDPLGPGIGRAVVLEGISYDAEGAEQSRRVRPHHAYLPQALQSTDGDRFATAARRTPGLVWVHRSYARSLLSAGEAGGLSRTAFLRLLGAADTPRLTPVKPEHHYAYTKVYSGDTRLGLKRDCMWFVKGRWTQMYRAGAGFTLDDLVSEDLLAVVAHIVAEKEQKERRRRTAALLRTLAGPLTSEDQAKVRMAHGYQRWNDKGQTAALWVWRLRDTAWLENSRGELCPPAELTLRTPDTEALYGQEDPNYLHPEIQRALATRQDVLTELGVSGDPDVPRLAQRLRELRKRCEDAAEVPEGLQAEALLVYRALARRLTHRSADTSQAAVEEKVRHEFRGEDLVLTDRGWKKSRECFRGPAILRGFRAFALTGEDLDPVWRVLYMAEPGAGELVDVLREIAGSGDAPDADGQQVMLYALRRLRDLLSGAHRPVDPGLRSKLRGLPLWTTAGWVRRTKGRQVFAVTDPAVERSLGNRLPLWKPGGNVLQFTALLGLLHVTPLEVANAEVPGTAGAGDLSAGDLSAEGLPSEGGPADATLTEDFRSGVVALQDLLVRDEPETAEAFTGWNWLAGLDVRLRPGLTIRLEPGGSHGTVEFSADAHIDRDRGTLFLAHPEALRTKPGAGAAIAAHFAGQRSRVGHAWRDIWEEGLVESNPGTALVSAEQRDREERQRLAEQLHRRAQQIPPVPASRPGPKPPEQRAAAAGPLSPAVFPPAPTTPSPTPSPAAGPQQQAAARTLVDGAVFEALPRKVVVRDGTPPRPGIAPPPPHGSPREAPYGIPLPRPRAGGAPLHNQAPPRAYADHDKEELTLRALGRILQEQGLTLEEQRGVSGLGTDAVDSAGRYYEIKAHGQAVPGELSLTRAEFVRAWSEGTNYTLVIASHLAEGAGTPTLRLVNDPVHRFAVEPTTDVKLKGVRNPAVECTVYDWPEEA